MVIGFDRFFEFEFDEFHVRSALLWRFLHVTAQVHHWRGKVLPVNWTEVEFEVLRTQKLPDVQAEVLLKRTATEMRSWMDEGQRRMNCFGEIPQFQFHHFASTCFNTLDTATALQC